MSSEDTNQPLLPGLEMVPDEAAAAAAKARRRRRKKRAPDVDNIQAAAPLRVRKLFDSLRAAIVAQEGITERVEYDNATGAFAPSYLLRNRELVRLHLDPVLAATMTLDRGDVQLAKLLAADSIPASMKTQALKCARRSGRRVYLAFLARNQTELRDLLTLMRAHLSLAGQLTRRGAKATKTARPVAVAQA